jgi:exo-beta-1,3-glucanase (GH17 family)
MENVREKAMKYLVQTAYAAALIGLSSNVYAAVNGINYDPVHNPDWITAQQNGNKDKMQEIFTKDLAQIKAMGFDTIKTYYSTYCTDAGACIDPVAKLAQQAGLKVMLGLYVFPDHQDWTVSQTEAAVNQANDSDYGKAVIGIVVGNEDMFDDGGNANNEMQKRIMAIIASTESSPVGQPVTTAQREPDWYRLNESDPNCVLKNEIDPNCKEKPYLKIIGANIFPYWGGSPEKNNGKSVASEIQTKAGNLLTALKSKGVTRVIITEEGWPSCAGNWEKQYPQNAGIDKEKDYFSTWNKHQNQSYDSYYFAAYDMIDACVVAQGDRNNDSDKHFGLCSTTGQTKDSGLITCP